MHELIGRYDLKRHADPRGKRYSFVALPLRIRFGHRNYSKGLLTEFIKSYLSQQSRVGSAGIADDYGPHFVQYRPELAILLINGGIK
jgi:hypothetical protein